MQIFAKEQLKNIPEVRTRGSSALFVYAQGQSQGER